MGTTNLALNRPATASNSVLPYIASKAVDGSLTTFSRWLANSVPGWLCVDLGANYWINRWVVRHMSVAGWQSPDYNMCDFKLQGSRDNVTWCDLDAVVGNTASITDRSFTEVNVRFVRVYVTKGLKCNTQYASLMEFEVYQAPPASAYLSGLSISTGTLSPAPFAGKTIFAYTASVGYDTSSITVTPTAEDAHAVIKVNNVVVASGQVSGPIALNVGSNVITVLVTAADGLSQNTYTITVTRAASNNANLSDLKLNGTTISGFTSGTITYNVNVDNSVATAALTPFTADSSATVKVNGVAVVSGQASAPIALAVGVVTSIPVVVTAGDGITTKTYTVNVTRASSPYLSGLVVLQGHTTFPLNPVFGKTTSPYSVNVLATTAAVSVTPTAEDSQATITVNGTIVTSGIPSGAISLTAGAVTTITVIVTSKIGSISQNYIINVTRP